MISPLEVGNVGPHDPVWVMVNTVLLEPVVTGLFETIRIRYPAAVGVPAGIVIFIVPELEVDAKVPIAVGMTKLPAASDSCAVYIFPPVKVPAEVKSTAPASVVPAQSTVKGLPVTVPVVIVVIGTEQPGQVLV